MNLRGRALQQKTLPSGENDGGRLRGYNPVEVCQFWVFGCAVFFMYAQQAGFVRRSGPSNPGRRPKMKHLKIVELNQPSEREWRAYMRSSKGWLINILSFSERAIVKPQSRSNGRLKAVRAE
jgi:hypothetical protein